MHWRDRMSGEANRKAVPFCQKRRGASCLMYGGTPYTE